jgi:hypothetical protein
MSFALTKAQILDVSKTVTRRTGWRNLKAGDELIAVEKCMGLRKGEHQTVLGRLEVLSVSREPLRSIDHADCAREGFPDMAPDEFVEMFCRSMRCQPSDTVTRIEFCPWPKPHEPGEQGGEES